MATESPWLEVYRAATPAACDERLLLLEAIGIPAVATRTPEGFAIHVAAEHAARARAELAGYAAEPPLRTARALPRRHRGALAAALAYVGLTFVVLAASGNDTFGRDWFDAGVLDGARVRAGDWWRAATALTLHADLGHYAANAGFGALFGGLAGRVYGPGRAWFAILAAAVVANLANAAWMAPGRASLGASTAVFAALGLLATYRWPATRPGARASIRASSVVAALVLLALLGTGDARTDVLAHALGFVGGLGAGALLRGSAGPAGAPQWPWAAGALALVVGAWSCALGARATLAWLSAGS
jgi:membrane associated rhomboid family serine protease